MTWTIDIDAIAGIVDGRATIEPGLNAVRAANWQGKSSFVRAIETALGTAGELTEGADTGRVKVRTPDRDVTVELVRDGTGVTRDGTPYLDDEYDRVRADLFACLGGHNEVRRAVRHGENLEDVLMRPLDFQNIDEQIADLQRERERVEAELSQATEAKKRLPTVQEKVTRLENEIADLHERRARLESGGTDGDGASAQQRLSRARSEKTRTEKQVTNLEQTVERIEDRLSERRTELEALDVPDEDVDERLETAKAALSDLKRDTEIVQSVYSATELVLEADRLDLITEVQRDIAGDSVACWTCGTEVTREQLRSQLDRIGTRLTALKADAEQHRDEVETLEARREQRRQTARRERDLESEIADLEETLADRQQSLADARARLEDVHDRVETLSETADETVAELSDIESEVKYREAELDDAKGELSELEARAERVDTLESRVARIRTEIEELRTRKDRTTREVRETFDDAMQDIAARFETGFETARLTADFDVVVARDGRETSLEALSEGEIELVGFVAALAGWSAFDVASTVPLILVDSVGGLDDANLHTLIEYLRERTDYLVFTAYPEYAAFDGQEIDPTQWTVAGEGAASAE